LQRRDEDVEVAGRVDVEEGLFPGHRAGCQRGVRIAIRGVGREILWRGAYDAGENLVPDPVSPTILEDAVPRQPLLLRAAEHFVFDEGVGNEAATREAAVERHEPEKRATAHVHPTEWARLGYGPALRLPALGDDMHVLCGAPEVDQGAVGEHAVLASRLALAPGTLGVHDAVDSHVVRRQSQPGDRSVVADRDIDVIRAGLEKECMARGIELARGQNLNLRDRVYRALNRARGQARVKDGHVRSEVRLHGETWTERANRAHTAEKDEGGNLHGRSFRSGLVRSTRDPSEPGVNAARACHAGNAGHAGARPLKLGHLWLVFGIQRRRRDIKEAEASKGPARGENRRIGVSACRRIGGSAPRPFLAEAQKAGQFVRGFSLVELPAHASAVLLVVQGAVEVR
jgi:hypothetical protein